MSEGSMLDSVALDALLRDRSQYQTWLAKLDAAADKAPSAVTAKVRADYESRLATVVQQLRAHAGTVGSALEQLRATLGAVEARDAAAAERLAEAELRHLVGEYDDGAWEALRAEVDGERRGLHADLEHTRQEIARLADVQAIILEAPAAPTPAPIEVAPAPAADPAPAERAPAAAVIEVVEVVEQVVVVEAPAPVPEPAPTSLFTAPTPKAMDELDFLKSVTDDTTEAEAPAAAHRPARAVAAPLPGEKVRTLKCGECGSENKPSEWYCERCGAELTEL